MYHYDPEQALTELTEDSVLPPPARLRDMIVRAKLTPEQALELNRAFQQYLHAFGELERVAKPVLKALSETERR